jgi:hypothetical protein
VSIIPSLYSIYFCLTNNVGYIIGLWRITVAGNGNRNPEKENGTISASRTMWGGCIVVLMAHPFPVREGVDGGHIWLLSELTLSSNFARVSAVFELVSMFFTCACVKGILLKWFKLQVCLICCGFSCCFWVGASSTIKKS